MNRIFSCLMSLLVLPLGLHAQMHGYDTRFELSRRNFCDTIPIEIENDQVYIRVEINGRELCFNLDTGSSQGIVYEESQIEGLTELGNVVSHDANQRTDTVKVVALPPFRIGSLTVSHYVASLLRRPAIKRRYNAVLGFDIFNKGICAKIDAQKKILILTDRRKWFEGEPGFAVKYKLKWFVPYLLASPFIRHVDEVLFDLGSRPLYTMSKESFDKHSYKSRQVNEQVEGRAWGHLTIASHGTETEAEIVFLHLDRLKWGDFSFRNVRSITTQGASRIGAQILRYGNIIINPFRRRIIFQPHHAADNVEVGNKHTGVAFVPADGKAAIGLIWEGCDAYKCGMRQGDVVLRIDDTPIHSFDDFVNFPFVEGRRYKFLLNDKDGKNKELIIQR
ncbi:aspartyl protease [Prevotella sp. KH2C16]|uniref:aspartyl protease n=1 Tax=Prevotella sp. KH2C16 TaxID=1855325 RepID=UPI0008E648A7|nr:aspartyl protease [Prevotella sp. KH2C16]SFG65158.1 hypothetical protein SAMN05216383_1267 [Prevotella sp. KH2C16]